MKGVSTKATSLSWTVARVHYSADPEKDPGAPWPSLVLASPQRNERARLAFAAAQNQTWC